MTSFTLGKPTYAYRNAYPAGALVGIQPGSGDAVPLAGRSVSYRPVPGAAPAAQAVTDATGRFTGGDYVDVR
ncbi:hypothetical protein [Streptomyces sp. NK15101]|uniref:hypothetical protein n=1 Tax=Streptomyces sp. NK15101 TaxID=2873261 RepID=UPI001CECCEFC|nr:hypothetical protein [Streptomyces sp. NK15101]